jgi:hypothetical protein
MRMPFSRSVALVQNVCLAEVESANGIPNDLTCDRIRQHSLELREREGEESSSHSAGYSRLKTGLEKRISISH